MITAISGTLERVLEDEIRLLVGAIEYQVLIPEVVRRAVQTRVGETMTFKTLEYLEGDPRRGRLTPRLVGFTSEPEIEFFELFCTVDGIGVRTALKALGRPIRDIADMIQRQDIKMLATLPGISSAAAERIVAKLRKKVTKFALMRESEIPDQPTASTPDVVQDAYEALVSVGHSDNEARMRIEKALTGNKKFKTAQDLLLEVYQQQ